MIVSSSFHVPPCAYAASASRTGAPPATSAFCSWPCAKNATHLPVRREERLLGSVRTGHQARLERVHVTQVELRVAVPLPRDVGDRAAVARDGRIGGDLLAGRKRDRQSRRRLPRIRGPLSTEHERQRRGRHAARARPSRPPALRPSSAAPGPGSGRGAAAIHSSSPFKSRTDCQRSSGSFARHVCSDAIERRRRDVRDRRRRPLHDRRDDAGGRRALEGALAR